MRKRIKYKNLDIKDRICLNCNKKFKSAWIGNRICNICSNNSKYKMSETIFDETASVNFRSTK